MDLNSEYRSFSPMISPFPFRPSSVGQAVLPAASRGQLDQEFGLVGFASTRGPRRLHRRPPFSRRRLPGRGRRRLQDGRSTRRCCSTARRMKEEEEEEDFVQQLVE